MLYYYVVLYYVIYYAKKFGGASAPPSTYLSTALLAVFISEISPKVCKVPWGYTLSLDRIRDYVLNVHVLTWYGLLAPWLLTTYSRLMVKLLDS